GKIDITDMKSNKSTVDLTNIGTLQGVINAINTAGDGFTFVTGVNDSITYDDGNGNKTVSLTNSSLGGTLIPGRVYSGAEVAAALEAALESPTGANQYTVNYNYTTHKFDITNDGGDNSNMLFTDSTSTAADDLGFTADKVIAGGGTASSDNALGTINIIAGLNQEGTAILLTDTNPAAGGKIKVEEGGVNTTTAKDLGLLGSGEESQEIYEGDALNPDLTAHTPLRYLNDGEGLLYPLTSVEISIGSERAIVDLSSATTVGDVIYAINNSGLPVFADINDNKNGIKVLSTENGKTLRISEVYSEVDGEYKRTAELVGIKGSRDLIGNLMDLKQALLRNDGNAIEATLDRFDEALDRVIINTTYVGSKMNQLDDTELFTLNMETTTTSLLSNIEDADISKVISDFMNQKTLYEAALASAKEVMNLNLLDFLI
ncbi:MAG: hypothetical protein SV062_05290, partial [Thermodesulfobacteriota bacterium]|nr:hypothetical protein [Thermodesulfobacteriota bacterium]